MTASLARRMFLGLGLSALAAASASASTNLSGLSAPRDVRLATPYPSLEAISPEMFGAIGDGVADDTAAWTACLARGGNVVCAKGRSYTLTLPMLVPQGTHVDFSGSSVTMTLSGNNDRSWTMRSYTSLRNGALATISQGSPGSQAFFHSAVTWGPLAGESPSPANISPNEGVHDITLENLTLSTTKPGGCAIAGAGGCYNIEIHDIIFPDSASLSQCMSFDWAVVGAIVANPSTAAQMNANKALFNAGSSWTTHPYNISISNISAGELSYPSDPGSGVVRFSAARNYTVANVSALSTTGSFFANTAGDLGFEYAPAEVKTYRDRAMRVDNISVAVAGNVGVAVRVDAYADNVALAVAGGYTPLLPVTQSLDFILTNPSIAGTASASSKSGIQFVQCLGGRVIGGKVAGALNGVHIDQGTTNVILDGLEITGCWQDGVSIENASTPPQDCTVENCRAYGNGLAGGTWAGIHVVEGVRIALLRNQLGDPSSELSQELGIRLENGAALAITVQDNMVFNTSGGAAYSNGATNDYSTLWLFTGNQTGAGVGTPLGGQNIIPFVRGESFGNDQGIAQFYAAAGVLTGGATPPSAFVARLGDMIWYDGPSSGGHQGSVCTNGGTPGTWKTMGSIS